MARARTLIIKKTSRVIWVREIWLRIIQQVDLWKKGIDAGLVEDK